VSYTIWGNFDGVNYTLGSADTQEEAKRIVEEERTLRGDEWIIWFSSEGFIHRVEN
jgi:hypothetical protein